MGIFSSNKDREREQRMNEEKRAADKAVKRAKKLEAKQRKEALKAVDSNTKGSLRNKDRPYFSKIERPLSGGSGQCFGCKYELDKLFREQRDRLPTSQRKPVVFHDSFQQLRDCATDCRSCRVFERALVRVQSTLEDEKHLEHDNTRPAAIFARLVLDDHETGRTDFLLEIGTGELPDPTWQAFVWCTRAKRLEYLQTVHIDPNDKSVYQQANAWLDSCISDHDQCRRLFWSGSNPTRLIKILTRDRVQLVDMSSHAKVPYVALSYCWGPQLPSDEWALIVKGMTWGSTINRRLQPFDVTEFPKTLLDTIRFVHRMGIDYVWIDAVCIIQDDEPNPDKAREMGRMHEYYGNARFTLCLSSSTKSTEGFLRARNAWKFAEGSSEIGGYEILNIDIALEDASEHSPWATRAWTLQEEHLSPRRLYWFNQSLYWSCAQSTRIEGIKDPENRRKPFSAALTLVSSLEGNFLVACFKDNVAVIKSEWLRIVESYARRDIGKTVDRFRAISGVASRYYQALLGRDQYVGGLWRNNFAELLAWQVIKPATRADRDSVLAAIASWSWASLPIKTGIYAHPTRFPTTSQPSEVDLSLVLNSIPPQNPNSTAEEAIANGSRIKTIQVQGKLRPFWLDRSILRLWHDVFTTTKDGREILSPEYSGIASIHSVHPSDGRVVVAGDRKEEVYGNLDYIEDVLRAVRGELRIYALQLSSSAVLLVEKYDENTYRRVGVCHNFWPHFIVDFDSIVVTLV
ncbi:HET-domain-containing protein [Tothia fuscella]|uniref:HET-domain-containing protein n=1 Tax=Tothia fuscella TaxID=1048955 RepID=A0A9P4NQP0_9PEZI|nr:HET-domain-containing protein [Tothia fuscella]